MAMVLSWTNFVDSGTVTDASVGGGSTTLPAANVQTRQLGDVFRHDWSAVSPIAGGLKLNIDLGSSKTFNMIAILNHNMPGEQLGINLSTVSAGGADVAALAPFADPDTAQAGYANDAPNSFFYFPAGYTARYVQITYAGIGPTRPNIDIGRVWVDNAWSVKVAMDFAIGVEDSSILSESRGGSVYSTTKKRRRVFNCRAFGITTDDVIGNSSNASVPSFMTFDAAVGTSGECILMTGAIDSETITTGEGEENWRMSIYGYPRRNDPIRFIDKGANGFISEKSFQIVEAF